MAEKPGASDSERETARAVMARFVERYGTEVEIPEEEEIIERSVTYIGEREQNLAHHCGIFMELKVLMVGKTVRGKFKHDGYTYIYKGYSSSVESAVALYEHHRERLRRLLLAVENGYCYGAMPLKPGTATGEGPKLTEAEIAALRAGLRAGKDAQLQKHLTGGQK